MLAGLRKSTPVSRPGLLFPFPRTPNLPRHALNRAGMADRRSRLELGAWRSRAAEIGPIEASTAPVPAPPAVQGEVQPQPRVPPPPETPTLPLGRARRLFDFGLAPAHVAHTGPYNRPRIPL